MRSNVIALVVALSFAGQALAEHDHSHHDHSHHVAGDGQAVKGLQLDAGKKWETDAPLRQAMTRVRDEVNAAVGPIHAKTFTPEQYKGLAQAIENQIAYMVANCRLPAATDAQLHLVIADLASGATKMKADEGQFAGVLSVVKALAAYPKFFAHDGWKPIEH